MSEGLLVEVCNVESPQSIDDGQDTKHEKLVPQVHAKLQSLLQTQVWNVNMHISLYVLQLCAPATI